MRLIMEKVSDVLAQLERRLTQAYIREMALRPCCQTSCKTPPRGKGEGKDEAPEAAERNPQPPARREGERGWAEGAEIMKLPDGPT